MARSPKTVAELAKLIGVTTKTIGQWRDNHRDWPGKERNGTFSVAKVRSFAKRHKLGPFRNEREVNAHTAARIEKIRIQTERERIALEKEQVEYGILLRQILLADDVYKCDDEYAGIINMELDVAVDATDQALPPSMSYEERERVLNVIRRIRANICQALRAKWKIKQEGVS